ncbi:hypothetical protein OG529_04390 [Streptomyces longwoodensis]|uniref:hypothetical protein n=1 Tax=Streptomyces longwoodensis TaxID=68231 RepID=UPI0032533C29
MSERRLIGYVHVDGDRYGPDDQVPAEVAKRIGDHAWTDSGEVRGEDGPETLSFSGPGEDQDQDQGQGEGEAPPRSGRGSGIEAWRAFAEEHGVGIDEGMTRDDVIAACEAAGVVEPEQPKEE